MRRHVLGLLGIALLAVAMPAGAQSDNIRGHVVGPDAVAIPGATVVVTAIPGHDIGRARTDERGQFVVVFPSAHAGYSVEVAAWGYSARRFELKRNGTSSEFNADTRLEILTVALRPVHVRAARRRPERSDESGDAGRADRRIDLDAVGVDEYGNLAVMASAMPGVIATPAGDGLPAGFSVFGLSASQNSTTLNGLEFQGTELPANAPVSMALSTGPYDVSRGGFSGAQFVLQSRRGTNYLARQVSVVAETPATQWSDQVARDVGQEYARETIGTVISGPIKHDRAFYSFAGQFGQRASDLRTLLNTDVAGLRAAGVALDSVSRLLALLRQLGMPSNPSSAFQRRVADNGSLFGSFDIVAPKRTAGHAFNLTYSGSWNKTTPSYLLPTDLPTRGAELTSFMGTVQGRHSSYFGSGILSETMTGVNVSRSATAPFFRLPAANVLVTSTWADGTSGIGVLGVGGATNRFSQSTVQASGRNKLSWYSHNERHLFSMSSELRLERAAQIAATNEFGTFTFDSLSALAAGRPSSFTRSLSARPKNEAQWTGAISIGDLYKPVEPVEIQYGIRIDGNRFVTAPQPNAAVVEAFGERNDAVPSRAYLSPRVGVAWLYGKPDSLRLRGKLQGGVGVFQGLPAVTSIAAALANTGLVDAVQPLTCVGSSTPAPDWRSYSSSVASIPSLCDDGATGIVVRNPAPNVVLYDPAYRASRSIRANLDWTLPVHGLVAHVGSTYSLSYDESSFRDLNLRNVAQFGLAAEGNRPVFVSPERVSASGGVSDWRSSRRSANFAHITMLRSDARTESRQLSIAVQPAASRAFIDWSVAYLRSLARERQAGFGATNGDPLVTEWAPSARDWRHQVWYTVSVNPRNLVRITWAGSLVSGLPFTPMVAGDINGDGYGNDRAFIFSAADSSVSAVASGMRRMLDGASANVRDCLRAQEGRIAARASCRGSWQGTSTLTMRVNPARLRLPGHAVMTLTLSSPLGALDRWLHGTSGLRGWDAPDMPSSTLLYVRGFNAQNRQFVYDVNPRFGRTDRSLAAQWNPPRLTVLFTLDASPSQERQMVVRELDKGRRTPGDIYSAESLRRSFGAEMDLPNPMAGILRRASAFGLTTMQADSIASMNASYVAVLRSAWNPVWTTLGALPRVYDPVAAYRLYREAREASIDCLIALAPPLTRLLTEEQRRLLTADVRVGMDVNYLRSIRSGTLSQGVRGMIH